MNERTRDLYRSIVGSTVDYSFKRTLPDECSINRVIDHEKRRITESCEKALEVGGALCVTLLSELTSYYSKQNYYMAVRGSIKMLRYRKLVLEYLELTVEERANRLLKLIKSVDKYREVKIMALGYFLRTYPSRISMFKIHLSKEELTLVI